MSCERDKCLKAHWFRYCGVDFMEIISIKVIPLALFKTLDAQMNFELLST